MHYARNMRLFISCDFHNKQRLVPYATLTEVKLSVRYRLHLFISSVVKRQL